MFPRGSQAHADDGVAVIGQLTRQVLAHETVDAGDCYLHFAGDDFHQACAELWSVVTTATLTLDRVAPFGERVRGSQLRVSSRARVPP